MIKKHTPKGKYACDICEKAFGEPKTLRLHIRQDHENSSDDEGMNENKTVEGEHELQHEDSELDENNDEEHKDQSCRSKKENILIITKDGEIENCADADDDKYVHSIQGETAETKKEVLCLLVKMREL